MEQRATVKTVTESTPCSTRPRRPVLPLLLLLLLLAVPILPAGLRAAPGRGGNDKPISGYASASSVVQGGRIALHVSTIAPTFDVQIEDAIDPTIVLAQYHDLPGVSYAVPESAYANGCAWPVALTVFTDPAWPSGVYYARLSAPTLVDTAFAPFVILEDQPGSTSNVLFQCSVNTYQAYNAWGGRSLYPQNSQGGHRAYWVSFDRPYDEERGRGQFPWWEAPLAAWLRQEGIPVEFSTDVDLHLDPGLLDAYDLFLVVGHDEYWSKAMYDQLEAYRDAGGNVAFLSGNEIYWAVRLENSGRRLICYKDYTIDPYYELGLLDEVTDLWRYYPLDRPEAALVGVSYDSWCVRPCGRPLVTRAAHHWTIRGLGLSMDDELGRDVVGYEWDRFWPGISPPGTQVVLATPVENHSGDTRLQHTTYYEYPGPVGGAPVCRVFAAGTVQWSWGLAGSEPDPRMQTATRRIVRCLSTPQHLAADRTAVFRLDVSSMGYGPESLIWLYIDTPLDDPSLSPVAARDDGVWPDSLAADGIFTAAVTFPAGSWAVPTYHWETTGPCSVPAQPYSAWLEDPETLAGGVAWLSVDEAWCPVPAAVAEGQSGGSDGHGGQGGDGYGGAGPGGGHLQLRVLGAGAATPVARIEVTVRAPLIGRPLRAALYDVRGRLVTVLGERQAAVARERLEWRGAATAGGGIYFVQVRVGAEARIAKLLRVR